MRKLFTLLWLMAGCLLAAFATIPEPSAFSPDGYDARRSSWNSGFPEEFAFPGKSESLCQSVTEDFHTGDLNTLKTIRNTATSGWWRPISDVWRDDTDPKEWPGIQWTSTPPYRVTELTMTSSGITHGDYSGFQELKILLVAGNQIQTLNITGLTKLERLNAQANLLTSLNTTGATNLRIIQVAGNRLKELIIPEGHQFDVADLSHNNLTFSKLLPTSLVTNTYFYTPQRPVFEEQTIEPGSMVNFSSEEWIGATRTSFKWMKNLQPVEGATSSSYTPAEEGYYYCIMTNDAFKGLTLTTQNIKVGNPPEFFEGNLAVLRSIRDNADASKPDPLSKIWSDEIHPANWQGVIWSELKPRQVVQLILTNKGINYLDVTGLKALTYLYCPWNQIQTLKAAGLSDVTQIIAGNNQIESVDVSGNTALRTLALNDNNLTSLNVAGLSSLYNLNVSMNQISNLVFKDNSELNELNARYNQLTGIDLSELVKIKNLYLNNNTLKTITLPAAFLLNNVQIQHNNLPLSQLILPEKVMIDYRFNPQNLIFEEKTIEAGVPIDFSGESPVNGIPTGFNWFRNNELIEGVNSAVYIPQEDGYYYCTMANANFPGLSVTTRSIKVGNPPEFDAGDLAILKTIRDQASTDVWEPLATIWADDINPGEWPGVYWSDNPPRRVIQLYIGHKGISALDVTGLSQLTELYCYGNQMQYLKVSGLANLRYLDAGSNQLTSLDFSGLTELTGLNIYFNLFSSLDLTGLDNLDQLNCDGNPLESLDLRSVPKLRNLNSWNNELSEILVDESMQISYANLMENRLPFSQLYTFMQIGNYFEFQNQKPIFKEQTIDPGTAIDFSSEAMINGVPTVFAWYKNGQLIEGATSAMYTPTEEAYYHAVMTNATFPDLVLTTRSIKVGNPPEFDPGDLAILKTIRDNAPADVWLPLATIWADDINPGEWPGVTWSTQPPRRVNKLDIGYKGIYTLDVTGLSQLTELRCYDNQIHTLKVNGLANLIYLNAGSNQLTSIDLSGLSSIQLITLDYNQFVSVKFSGLPQLQNLSLTGNQITEIELSGLDQLYYLALGYNKIRSINLSAQNKLNYVYLNNNLLSELSLPANQQFYFLQFQYNNLPFSQLVLPEKANQYHYNPQNLIFEEQTIDPGTLIDFSNEALINGVATVFAWYKNGQLIEGATSSTYTPTEEAYYYCVMTNATFPDLVLTTRSIKVGNPPEFDPGDLAILKTIRDQASTDVWEPLVTIWADDINPGEWQGVTWSEQPPRRVITLQVNGKGISQMDVTDLIQLTDLHCFDNQMQALEVSGLTNLQYLGAWNNQLANINLSGLDNLRNLYLSENKLSSIDLTGLNQLWNLGLENNQLSSINLSGLNNLRNLYLSGNQLTSVNLTGLNRLWELGLGYNKLTTLDISGLTNLRYLHIQENKLKELTADPDLQLYGSYLHYNNLPFSQLILPGKVLNWFYYNPQNLIFEEQTIDPGTTIDFSSEALINGVATVFAWYKNGQLIDGVTSSTYTPTKEAYYYCVMTNATFPDLVLTTRSIKVGNPPEFDPGDLAILKTIRDQSSTEVWEPLADIWADDINPVEWPGVTWSEQPPRRVINLQVNGKGIGQMDVTGLSQLTDLRCFNNQLQVLEVSGLTNLQYLGAWSNQLADINLSGLDNLRYLYLSQNKLTSIDLTGLNQLWNLGLENNQLSIVNLSGLNQLWELGLGFNKLFTLDISGLTNLGYLHIQENKLKELTTDPDLLLYGSSLQNNNLPFSQLILPEKVLNWFYYNPQNLIFEEQTIDPGTPIDFSSEAMINGVPTVFAWYKNGQLIEGATSSTYTPTEEAYYYCVMTNATFPDLALTTRSIKVGNPPEFDPGDLAILKTIRNNASTEVWEPLADFWADAINPGEWTGVYWSEQIPRRVISLQVNGKGIGQMDVTGLSQLVELHCANNQIQAIGVAGLANLQYLYAWNNQLADINLSGLNNLRYLYLSQNKLTSIDLTGLNQLWDLGLDNNQLTSVTMTGLNQLRNLDLQNNKLTSLGLQGLQLLSTLYLSNNLLTDLDITGLPNLRYFNANNNKLKKLTADPDLQLYGSNLLNNNLPFSQLILPGKVLNGYYYTPQNRVFENQQIKLGDAISYASEQWIDGTATHFTWYKDGTEIPGAGNSYTYTPVEEGFYHCIMTSDKFPGLELRTSLVTVGNPTPEFDPGDLAVLLNIRENTPQWSWLRYAWADEDLTGSWPNVTWTEIEPGKPKRVTSLHLRWMELPILEINALTELNSLDCSGNHLQTLDLSGLEKLQFLYCAYNKLTTLSLDDLESLINLDCSNNELTSLMVPDLPYLSWVNCENNRFSFSRMTPSTEVLYIQYNPQKEIYQHFAYEDGKPISYPDEVFAHGHQTIFTWYKNNEPVLTNDLTGSFTPDGEGYYYCTMTNEAFPWVTLRTEPVKLGNPPEYDPYDVSVLIAIRDAAPAGSRLKTDWADPANVANWPYLVWDFAPKKLVVMNVTNALLTNLVVPGLAKLTQIYCQDNQISTLQLSNLPLLEYLDARNNQISQPTWEGLPLLNYANLENNQMAELDVSELTNMWYLVVNSNQLTSLTLPEMIKGYGYLYFNNNHLPFSAMPLRIYHWGFEYIPQGKIFTEDILPVFTPIDFSSEAVIGGTGTQFTWYFNGNPIEGTDQSGIYTPQVPGEYFCEMTNDQFPGLVLTTHTITVINAAPEVACNNIEVMPGMDGLYTLTAADVAKIAAGTTDMTDRFEQLQITVTPSSFNLFKDVNPAEVMTEVTNSVGLTASCNSYVVMLKRPTTLVLNSMTGVQYSDRITISATLTDAPSKLPVPGMELTFELEGALVKAVTDNSGVASVEYTATGAPGPVKVGVSYPGNILFIGSSANGTLMTTPEDAVVNYIGTEIAATASATSLTARIDLRASVSDIADLHRGDIRNAMIKFVNLTSGSPSDITGWLSVEDLTDPATGVVNYPWTVTLQKNQTAETFTIGIVAGGYYTAYEQVVLTVYVPSGDYITGGGHILPSGSAGLCPSDEGSKTRFGFNIRYNKKGTATQGKLNFIFRSGGRTWQVTSNAIESLGINTADPVNRMAQFVAKCTMTDITNPGSPVGMGGNLTMMINMSEVGDNDWEDKISFTLWSGNKLLYSSNWDGAKSNLLPLANGQVVISSATVSNGKKSAEIAVSEAGSAEKALSVYPNPFTERVFIDVKVENTVPVLIEMFTITGMKVATLFDGQLEAGVQTRFEYRPENIPAQILIYRILTGDEQHTGRLVYRPVN
jgi:Leucine-rich repeat (LRR) protein